MKKTTQWLVLLLCIAIFFGAAPVTMVSAADATTQLKYDATANGNSAISVTGANDGSFKMTLNNGIYESGLVWNVQVDVSKTRYWIINTKSMQQQNNAKVMFLVNDCFVGYNMLSDRWAVVDLTPYANSKGMFSGKLELFYQDYNYSKGTKSRSITEIGGMWLSASANLNGKVNTKKTISTVNMKNVITSKTVAKYDNLLFSPNVLSEKVSETSFAMWVDPDQELETYAWYGFAEWYVCIDLNKVPYLYINLAENETAYSLLVHVLDSAGRTQASKNYNYVTAGHSGWQVYDLKSDLAKLNAEYKGQMYLAICTNVDDGSSASGAQNFIKEIYVDTKLTPKTGGDTSSTSSTQTPTSKADGSTTQSSEAQSIQSDISSSDVSETVGSSVESMESDVSAEESETVGEPKSNKTWIFIVIAVIVVLAGAGTGGFFLLKKRKKL